MTDLKLVLFDVDGTLVDSQGHILASMELAFAAQDLPCPSRAEVLSIVGLSLPEAMVRLAPGADPHALSEAYKAAYADLRQRGDERALSPLYPGIRPLIDALRAIPELLIGVATGKSRRGLAGLARAHGLDFLATTQVADDHPSKPHPSMIEAALSETGVDAARCVMVGDTTFDMQMARSADVGALAVAWGYHGEAALLALADTIASDADELHAQIAQRLELS